MDNPYKLPEPSPEELTEMYNVLRTLDPLAGGVELSNLRAYYPRLGWGHIIKRLEALEQQGRAQSGIARRGNVPVQRWTWTPTEVS